MIEMRSTVVGWSLSKGQVNKSLDFASLNHTLVSHRGGPSDH